MDQKKVTVITVCFNAANVIEETMRSVLFQHYGDLEYIVVDGASEDGTLDIIKRYQTRFEAQSTAFLYISEPDSGIYNAMNKGAALAQGEYVLFLNAGDVLASANAIAELVGNADENSDIIYGNHYVRIKEKAKLCLPEKIEKIEECSIFCHQAALTRTALLKAFPFNEKYRIIADYDFFLKQYLDQRKFEYVNANVVYYDLGGISQTGIVPGKKENLSIRIEQGIIKEAQAQSEWKRIMRIVRKHMIKNALPLFIRTMKYKKVDLDYIRK